jgi:uncharacterized protein YfcZ (UPF0381/DUF406 family)
MKYIQVKLLDKDPTESLFRFDTDLFCGAGDVERCIKQFDDHPVYGDSDHTIIVGKLFNGMVITSLFYGMDCAHPIKDIRIKVWECMTFLLKCAAPNGLTDGQKGLKFISVSMIDERPMEGPFIVLENGSVITNSDVERMISYTHEDRKENHVAITARLGNGIHMVESAPCKLPYRIDRQAQVALDKIKLRIRLYLEFLVKCRDESK